MVMRHVEQTDPSDVSVSVRREGAPACYTAALPAAPPAAPPAALPAALALAQGRPGQSSGSA